MTREQFIRRWLANHTVKYDTKTRDEMRDDLDRVIEYATEINKDAGKEKGIVVRVGSLNA